MGKGWCLKCKQKVEVVKGRLDYYKNGTPVERGHCSVCDGKLTRMLNREERKSILERQTGEGPA